MLLINKNKKLVVINYSCQQKKRDSLSLNQKNNKKAKKVRLRYIEKGSKFNITKKVRSKFDKSKKV